MTGMIELTDVHKIYPGTHGSAKHVLKGVTITFPQYQNIGILGRNGAGKSTLLRIVAGIECPDFGEVRRVGRVSWPIGFSGGFNGSLTGEENCRFVARIYGESISEVSAFAKDFSELGNDFYAPVRTYSSGMRARLAFGVSMGIDFDVYLVDEVTAVGDRPFKQKCKEAFLERQKRASLIMVSHSMDTIRSYCSRCAVLEDGHLTLYPDLKSATDALDEVYASQPSRQQVAP